MLALFPILVCLCAPNLAVAQTEVLSSAVDNKIESVRLWHSRAKTRVVLDVSENIQHTMFSLKSPDRLVVDIENAALRTKLPSIDASNSHIVNLRSGTPRENVLRLVLELTQPMQANAFVLTPNELYGHRLVIDLIDQKALDTPVDITANMPSDPATASRPEPQSPLVDASSSQNEQTNDASQKTPPVDATPKQARKLTIAIDAGHGGEDPGALGHRGSREKAITLSISKHLKKILDQDPRMQAFLVREGDYYVDLSRRRTLARQRNADIFISIHADAFDKKSANGLSVFALSQRGATSAMARALAKKENAADLIGGVSLADKDQVLAQVLVDLSMTNTISESVNLGGRVLKELSKVGRLHSKRVEQAAFAVLKSPDIPSILVETGFITNLNEERRLRTSKYQKKIARAIHAALGDYFEQTPYYSQASYSSPKLGGASNTKPGTSPRTHTVKRGDSLSSIALKYSMSVSELKRLNKLKSNVAVLGRKLKVSGIRPTTRSTPSKQGKNVTHIVGRGDSLSKISASYNVTIQAIKRENGLSKDAVYLGQRLTIPSGGSIKAKRTPASHKVKRGDTLSEIAEQYGVSIKALMRENKMRSRTVMLGQTLKIPQ